MLGKIRPQSWLQPRPQSWPPALKALSKTRARLLVLLCPQCWAGGFCLLCSQQHSFYAFLYEEQSYPQQKRKKSSVWQEGIGPVSLIYFAIKQMEKYLCLTGRSRARYSLVFRNQANRKILCLTGRSRARQPVVFRFWKKKILCLTERSRARQPVVFRYQANGKKPLSDRKV
jgi:hypothetical protein